MNPNTVRGQSIASSIFLVALAVLDRPEVTLMLATSGLVWWAALNVLYGRALSRRDKMSEELAGRTQRRWDGDRGMAQQVVVANLVPIAVAVVCLAADVSVEPDLGPFQQHYVQGVLATFAATVVVWIGSSHVDWYYIRPRLDGVVRDPPCVTSGHPVWKGVTRKWYVSRAVASVATMAGAVMVALLLTVTLDREAKNLLAAIGGFNAISLVALWFMRDEIQAVAATREAIRSPSYALGDDVAYSTDFWRRRGYVLHVSVPKTKLVRLNRDTGAGEHATEPTPEQDEAGATTDTWEESAVAMYKTRIETRPYVGCASDCQRLNPECVHRQMRTRKDRTPVLVL